MSVPIINGNVDAALTRWVESANDDAPYAFILRLFTLQDIHAKDTIGKFINDCCNANQARAQGWVMELG